MYISAIKWQVSVLPIAVVLEEVRGTVQRLLEKVRGNSLLLSAELITPAAGENKTVI